MRAIICTTFGGYSFADLETLCADEFAEVAGAALWLKDQEQKETQHLPRKGRRR